MIAKGHAWKLRLYPDELAWLYNELGLVCYCQGVIPDSGNFSSDWPERLTRDIEDQRPGYRRIRVPE